MQVQNRHESFHCDGNSGSSVAVLKFCAQFHVSVGQDVRQDGILLVYEDSLRG